MTTDSNPSETDDEIPEWHFKMLEEREARIERGEAKWLSMDEVIKRLEAKYLRGESQ